MNTKALSAAVTALMIGSFNISAQDNVSEMRIWEERIDFDIPFVSKIMNRNRSNIELGAFCIGPIFTNAVAPMDFNPSSSIELFSFVTNGIEFNDTFELHYGLGVDWRHFTLKGNDAMYKTTDNLIYIGPYPAGGSGFSRLRIFSIAIPVLLSVNIYDGIGFSFGPVVEINAASRIKNKYKINDNRCIDKYKHAHCNILTCDLMAEINIRNISFFVKYSPMNVMDSKYWPEFQHISFGIAL